MELNKSLVEYSNNSAFFKLGIFALTGLFLLGMTGQPAPSQRVSSLQVVRGDQVVATLGSDELGGTLDFFSSDGMPAYSLRIGEHGGADLILGQGETRKLLTFRIQGEQLRITERLENNERLIYRTFQPEFGRDAVPGGQLDPRDTRILDDRIKHLDGKFDDLKREHDRLRRELSDLNPGLTDRNAVDRLARKFDDLRREQTDLDRELRSFRDDLRSSRTDRNDLRRKIQRLESRIK